MNKLAIVILNWNGIDYLRQYIPSVKQHSLGEHVVIWVADNGSCDGSLEYLREFFPGVNLIAFDHNYGFAGGYNKALSIIEADYFILLNSDVEVTPGWIEPMLELMESDESVSACMPKIKQMNRRDYFEYAGAAGGFIDYLGYPFCRGRIFDVVEKDNGQYNDVREIFWASGACMMIRAADWIAAGGFDPIFFAHMEEIDLCWRLKNMGKRVMVSPSSVVYHIGGGTLSRYNPKKTYLNFRNSLLMLMKNLPPGKLYLVLVRLVFDWLSVFKFILTLSIADAFAIIKAHIAFIWLLPLYFRKRKLLRKENKIFKHDEIYHESVVISFFIRGRKFFYLLD